MKKFIEIDHTADVAFRVFGKTKKKLFENSAFALYSFSSDIKKIRPKKKIYISIKGKGHQALLIGWLNELNFISQTRYYVFCLFKINTLTKETLEAEAEGEKHNIYNHGNFKEIKSVTFHKSEIRKTPQGYECTIVCDI
jgi:SHS2 domain-containing protein